MHKIKCIDDIESLRNDLVLSKEMLEELEKDLHDKEVTCSFEKRGWMVLRIWECELKKKNLQVTVEKLINALTISN